MIKRSCDVCGADMAEEQRGLTVDWKGFALTLDVRSNGKDLCDLCLANGIVEAFPEVNKKVARIIDISTSREGITE